MSDTENTGHRQRLLARCASGEERSRSEESLLELLLTYVIPHKNLQSLAKHLLSEFGSLSSVRATLRLNAERTRHRYTHDILPMNLIAENSLGEIRK